jgi:hypothetical protein
MQLQRELVLQDKAITDRPIVALTKAAVAEALEQLDQEKMAALDFKALLQVRQFIMQAAAAPALILQVALLELVAWVAEVVVAPIALPIAVP